MGDSITLCGKAIAATIPSNELQYGYQWEWCGVSIIRHPDEILSQQGVIWDLKPTPGIETGVAGGGSLTYSIR